MNHMNSTGMAMNGPMQVVVVEPYLYGALVNLRGQRIVIDTSRGSVNGTLVNAMPDHVVVQDHNSTFYVRTCEIVWFMPVD